MRGGRAGAALALVVVTASGCGFASAVAHPSTAVPTAVPSVTDPAPTGSAPAAASTGPVLMATVPLGGPAGSDLITVTRERTQTGLIPPVPDFALDCAVDFPALQYVPIEIDFGRTELAGHLTVTPGPDTPTDIGPIGVFFDGSVEPYCQTDPPFQTTDTFWSHSGYGHITAYVVLQDAVTDATPEGRPDVFPTLDVRIDHLRLHEDGDVPYVPQTPTVGALCPDDVDAVCVPLP